MRPCNHAICTACVRAAARAHSPIACGVCHQLVTGIVGFSAPMALPGQEAVDMSDTSVISLPGHKGNEQFKTVFELAGPNTEHPVELE